MKIKKTDREGYIRAGKDREHRVVWSKVYGSIPKGYVMHHIDEDRTNNNITNLQLMTKAEHQQLHAKGKVCKICGKRANARELCSTHYSAWHRMNYGRGNKMPDMDNRRYKIGGNNNE